MTMHHRMNTEAIIVHHTATRPGASIEAIRRYHVERRGWDDIGYHWLIRFGEVWPGRDERLAGAHAYDSKSRRGWNDRSIGVALVGDYTRSDPPSRQVEALVSLLASIQSRFAQELRILGHREAMEELGVYNYTTCPGSGWLDDVRHRLAVQDFPEWLL